VKHWLTVWTSLKAGFSPHDFDFEPDWDPILVLFGLSLLVLWPWR
jgi:hypothetical protein